MKMIAGATFRASEKSSRTRLAPTPTIISMNSDALALKNGTFASPAVARASKVFPAPGAPASSTPLGARAPRRRYFSGSFRKSTTSLISASTSSIPATSSNVTRTVSGSTRFCLPPPSSPPAIALLPLEHPHVETNEQEQRGKRNKQVGEEAPLLDQRCRTHGRASLSQLSQQIVTRERRTLGGELLIGAILLAGNGHRLLQLALDGITASKQLGNVLVGDLGLEVSTAPAVVRTVDPGASICQTASDSRPAKSPS